MDQLTRYPQRGGDRRLLDEILDEGVVAVLSTVADGLPWSIPIAYARVGERIVLHGSTGAGALRHVAAGAPATVTVTHLDALVVADTAFDHSMNYRSAVLRGVLEPVTVDGTELLDAFTDALLPGRSGELRAHTRKELAATTVLTLPITEDNWIAKARTGGASSSEGGWSGVLPLRKGYARIEPTPGQDLPVPASVRAAVDGGRAEDRRAYAS
ncbi:pyridoxamine 5'-phosphate oxidase family protein [Tsukamurella paurometabola]|nr:pyridoxamine 5'-phosphate oxidase family protein [Tsukamurella paurometabola]UEA85193.1 pyridoxamine 5'-phosphate oxidase family protein [Tsukamurella paurometabola]VDR37803.1 Predicted flavin-nucleotide-binding protein [Tsukamurella paurometabola]